MRNDVCPFGEAYSGYWSRRYDLFSRFDEGVQIDREGLFSAKPEKIALQIAESVPGTTVVDAMCGLGCVAIALARSGKHVIAIDKDADRLRRAHHNAKVYGVSQACSFRHADALEALSDISADAVFLDPPWGGPDYVSRGSFRMSDFDPDGGLLVSSALKTAKEIVLCGPRFLCLNELSVFGDVVGHKEHVMWGRVICVTVAIRRFGWRTGVAHR